jgi:phospholipid transport system substrate-binding protein
MIILERIMKKSFCHALVLATAFFCTTAVAVAAEMAPDALIKETSQDVLEIIKKDKDIQAGNKQKIYALVDAKVLPHFDFKRMTQLAVGKSWRQATSAQQDELVKEFRTLLVRTYSTSLSAYKKQTIDYKPLRMEPGDTDVTVRTVVNQPGGQPIPIDYGLLKTADGWKVYDVVVDNISLVTNYRGSFSSEIRKSGIDGLIRTLVEKNRSSEQAGAKG